MNLFERLRRWLSGPTWAEACALARDPGQICDLVRRHVRYEAEQVDAWSPAAATWERGYGDCEDLAVVVWELCRQAKVPARIVLAYYVAGSLVGHAVVCGADWLASNGEYHACRRQSDPAGEIGELMGWQRESIVIVPLSDGAVEKMIKGGTR